MVNGCKPEPWTKVLCLYSIVTESTGYGARPCSINYLVCHLIAVWPWKEVNVNVDVSLLSYGNKLAIKTTFSASPASTCSYMTKIWIMRTKLIQFINWFPKFNKMCLYVDSFLSCLGFSELLCIDVFHHFWKLLSLHCFKIASLPISLPSPSLSS